MAHDRASFVNTGQSSVKTRPADSLSAYELSPRSRYLRRRVIPPGAVSGGMSAARTNMPTALAGGLRRSASEARHASPVLVRPLHR